MKSVACAALLALSLLTFATSRTIRVQNSGPSANGSFQFTLSDGRTRYVEFDARAHPNGRTGGEMTFNDPEGVPTEDGSATSLYVKAEFDCLVVDGNKAVMSGAVKESNVPDYLGERVLLVVEDNGEGIDAPAPDRLTWGVYLRPSRDWTPQDAERPDDNGWSLHWIATDAERPDDAGISSRPSEIVGCQSFPLSAYSFVDVRHGDGNVQVRP